MDDAAYAWDKTTRYLEDAADILDALLNPAEHGLVVIPAEVEAQLRSALAAVREADALVVATNPRVAV